MTLELIPIRRRSIITESIKDIGEMLRVQCFHVATQIEGIVFSIEMRGINET